jgi:hypothetical protein
MKPEKVVVNRKNSQMIVDEWVTDNPTLKMEMDTWPKELKTVLGNRKPFHLISNCVWYAIYKQPLTKMKLTVYID